MIRVSGEGAVKLGRGNSLSVIYTTVLEVLLLLQVGGSSPSAGHAKRRGKRVLTKATKTNVTEYENHIHV